MVFTAYVAAQTPQAICYQAVAKDNQGNDMVDQDISIRATIVRGSPNGIVEWQETHNIATDQFALFTLNIGEGAYIGGMQTDFENIQWGSGAYWLRIEMDPFGGQNYSLMGATRIVSVPYSLYAKESKVATTAQFATHSSSADTANFAQVAYTAQNAQNAVMAQTAQTALTAQSTIQSVTSDTSQFAHTAATAQDDQDRSPTNELQKLSFANDTLRLVDASGNPTPGPAIAFGDNSPSNELQSLSFSNGNLTISNGNTINITSASLFGAPGASSDFPQGILGKHIVLLDELYTIPNGKVLYITAGRPNMKIQGYGLPGVGYTDHPTSPNMPILPQGTQISECFCTGILVDTSYLVTPVIINLSTTPGYSVPPGKALFVKSGIANDLPGRLIVNNQEMEFFRPNLTRGSRIVCFPENTLLKKPALYNEMTLTGYLINSQ